MRNTRTLMATVLVLAVMLLAGACSSGSKNTKSTTTGNAKISSDTGAKNTDTGVKSDTGSKSSKGDKADSAFCRKVKSYDDENNSDVSAKETIKALKDLKSAAPAEIKADIQTVIDFAEKFASIDTNNPAALASAAAGINTDDLNSASARLDTYVEQHCGITMSDG